MQKNLEAVWNTLDAWAYQVMAVDGKAGMQMLKKNKALMLDYIQLSYEMAQLAQQRKAQESPSQALIAETAEP